MLFRSISNLTSTAMLRTVMSKFKPLGVRPMASISEAMLNQLKATHGKPITCKAAVAWEPKTPLDVTDIQVYCFADTTRLKIGDTLKTVPKVVVLHNIIYNF